MKLHKSKLIQLQATLTNNELKWFGYYIQSPFFNKNENVIRLFHKLSKYHPEYDESLITPESLFKAVFEEEAYDEQKLRYVMTDLTKLLEDYLAYIEYEKSDIYRKNLLLKALNSRHQEKHFGTTLEETNSQYKKQSFRDVNYYFNRHLLEENHYVHSLSRSSRSISSSLQEAVDNLDLYYLSNRLRYSCAILNREDLLQEKYNNLFLDPILNFLAEYDMESVPSVAIYHSISMLYREPENPAHYQRVISIMKEHSRKFPIDEVKDMYVHALNYCFRRINGGHLEYLAIVLELYKTLIEEEIIFEEGYITPDNVKNIVTIALRTGQIEWTETFLESYKNRIVPAERESTFAYNMAQVCYYKKDFSRALRLLHSVEMDDIFYQLGAKSLLLRTYYELNEPEPFFSLADAFTNYLKRNKLISNSQRTVNLNFVKFARKLMQIRFGSRLTPEGVRNELVNVKSVGNLQWLSEKLEEISA
jgi:hypothetical protein